MERVTISLDETLLAKFDAYLRHKGYENRSEAIRDLVREGLERDRLVEDERVHAIGCLSYVYNHQQRELARRLTLAQHEHHGLILSALHVHLDHQNCLEVVLMQGHARDVRAFAEATMAETGVRHGSLYLVAADIVRGEHTHGGGTETAEHVHTHPET